MKSIKIKQRSLGQGMTEYIIIVALIAIAAIGVFSLFGSTVSNQVAGMAQEMSGTSAQNQINRAKNAAGKAVNVAKEDANLGTYNKRGTEAAKQ